MEARSQLRHRPTIRWEQLFYFRRSARFRQTREVGFGHVTFLCGMTSNVLQVPDRNPPAPGVIRDSRRGEPIMKAAVVNVLSYSPEYQDFAESRRPIGGG